MSFSGANYSGTFPTPISALQYPDVSPSFDAADQEPEAGLSTTRAEKRRLETEASAVEIEARIRQERADAVSRAEQQLRHEYDQKLASVRSEIAKAIETFQAQRADYFARVEAEVVQLALAIAAKILRREAQVDPMLIAALVRMAVDKMREGSGVTVRVGKGCGADWTRYFAGWPNLPRVEVVEDPEVSDQDCILETELGTAHFGLETQLKEVERGFFDLLALRPVTR
ncbi:MAG TPA: FliH/SctL family protein [Edaphobacter sp.]|uniref:FliH/SctL family protein n=1 Tax=Edaphobacter sp. TaxID=1934404 RepID=UPI002C16FFBA|nr:FliH/SctL family protein [Edaphobacter sp.]HUZ94112.1 FliH/SctL family protein [Edaphobacter sp.]